MTPLHANDAACTILTDLPHSPIPCEEACDMRAVRLALSRFTRVSSVEDLCTVTADIARSVTGAFRTEIYGFEEQGLNRLLAESMRGTSGAFAHCDEMSDEWPAGLCERLTHRRVMSVTADPDRDELFVSSDGTWSGPMIDHFAVMGAQHVVLAALTHQDRIIGVLACLCRTRGLMAPPLIGMLETLAGMASLQMVALRHQERLNRDRAARSTLVDLMETIQAVPPHHGTIRALGPNLVSMVNADGLAYISDVQVSSYGSVPADDRILSLVGTWRDELDDGPVLVNEIQAANDAERVGPPEDDDQGRVTAMLISIKSANAILIWFRKTDPERTHVDRSRVWNDIDVDCARRIGQLCDTVLTRHHLARTKAALRDQSARLTQSNDELERFAYIASHDLREPLRMVTSYCRLLEQRYASALDEPAREFIAFAVDGANRMSHLVNGLLTYSRIVTHGAPFEQTDPNLALFRATEALAVEIDETDADIKIDPLPIVEADPAQLALMFEHLIGNSLKFVPPGLKPRIKVSGVQRGPWLDIHVDDEGIGISATFADQIFDLFRRLHTREAYPGAGLGLAICRRVAVRHGGSIRLGEKSAGCRIIVTLPLSRRPSLELASA